MHEQKENRQTDKQTKQPRSIYLKLIQALLTLVKAKPTYTTWEIAS